MTLKQKMWKHLQQRGLTLTSICAMSDDIDQPNLSNICNRKIIASARQAIAIYNITNGKIKFEDIWEPWVVKKIGGETMVPKALPRQGEYREDHFARNLKK